MIKNPVLLPGTDGIYKAAVLSDSSWACICPHSINAGVGNQNVYLTKSAILPLILKLVNSYSSQQYIADPDETTADTNQ